MNKQQQTSFLSDERDVDAQLYDGFVSDKDKAFYADIHRDVPAEVPGFYDSRLVALWPLFKARNFPALLSDMERGTWEEFRARKLIAGDSKSSAARYFARLGELAERTDLTADKQYLLEELQLWGQSILPSEY